MFTTSVQTAVGSIDDSATVPPMYLVLRLYRRQNTLEIDIPKPVVTRLSKKSVNLLKKLFAKKKKRKMRMKR